MGEGDFTRPEVCGEPRQQKPQEPELIELPKPSILQRMVAWFEEFWKGIRAAFSRVNAAYDETKWQKFLGIIRDLLTLAAGIFKPKI
jgi:hypothetical protein